VRSRHLVAAAVVAVLLSGCAGTDADATAAARAAAAAGASDAARSSTISPTPPRVRTPEDIAGDASFLLWETRSARAQGTVTELGFPVEFDVRMQDGDFSARYVIRGEVASVVYAGGVSYARGTAGFWVAQGAAADAAASFDGVWLRVPGDVDLGQGDLSLLGIVNLLDPDSGVRYEDAVGYGAVADQRAVVLTQTDGTKVYVAPKSQQYVLRIEESSGATINLSEFGQPQHVTPPPDPVDLTRPGG
jgi:hypothetical protein